MKSLMASNASTLRPLAILGGSPTFPSAEPVPLIRVEGYGPRSDFSAIDAIRRNTLNKDSKTCISQQRFVAKILPGDESPGSSYRAMLQHRIGEFLELNPTETSIICTTSGTNALRALLKGVRAVCTGKGSKHEVIVPQTTVGATIEAVIAEGFKPVFVAIDPNSWLLSAEATKRSISEMTAAIITVDWLGTQCDLRPFRELADKHDIKLISDSAQSFGASSGQPPSIHLADATLYSLGYPKVLSAGGSGGLIVCSTSLSNLLEKDASGILRHETLAEANAFSCLRALDSLPEALAARGAAGRLYCQYLTGVPGITFQRIPDGLGTNHYQISFKVEAQTFGLNAKQLCTVLTAENVHCSVDRMPCVAANERLAACGSVKGDLEHSWLLATTSLTIPISNSISLETVRSICGLIELVQKSANDVLRTMESATTSHTYLSKSATIIDLESKFRHHMVVPILDDTIIYSEVLVPHDYLYQQSTSIDEFLAHFKSQKQWNLNERVIAELYVNAIIGTIVILVPGNIEASDTFQPVALDGSGSSASVALVPRADGQLTVCKSAEGYGIDGNGAPWLRKQSLFLMHSRAVPKTRMFVVPTKVNDQGNRVILELPYISSHSLGELVFANVGAEHLVTFMVEMLAQMATSVWTEGQREAGPAFLQKAHFDRMRRRVNIARKHDETLDKILEHKTVTLNGRQLLGFDSVMQKLETHPALANITPTILGEIHGDLNIHNVLSRLDPEDDEDIALIDPRGVSLLCDASEKLFERGDYCYDVSKLLFSLTGFLEIRKRLFDYSADGDTHLLKIHQHPGSDTMNGASHLLIPGLVANETVRRWIDEVEHSGAQSFELRVKVGEAANFVADCACALGRNTPWEIAPLFLLGLQKLNDVVDLLDKGAPLSNNVVSAPATANLGVVMIQRSLFGSQTSDEKWPYDVLEISVKVESASTTQNLLCEMVGIYLPKGTGVYLSTDPVKNIQYAPCSVIIHPSNGVRGQTHMLAAASRRTTAFFKDGGFSQDAIDKLRIVHISSTGSSSRSQFTSRDNDKLLSPGTFGISPLRLALLQANQLPFPKPGRWVVENDSFFLLSQPLVMSGDNLCLLAIKRPTSGSSSSWRACVDEYEEGNGLFFAKSFRKVKAHEKNERLVRTTTGLFIPCHLGKAISRKEGDYVARTSPLLFDVVLPRFMKREEWIQLCHKQGYGVDSHLVWQSAKSFEDTFKLVELANGGDGMVYHHFGSDREYSELLNGVPADPGLNSLAYAGAAVQWLQRRMSRASRLLSPTSTMERGMDCV